MADANDNLIPLDYGFIDDDIVKRSAVAWASGWKLGVVDISNLAGKTITINYNIHNNHYDDGVLVSRLLLDNIRFSVDGPVEEIQATYIALSAEYSPDEIRNKEIDYIGKSYVYYTHEFEDVYGGEEPLDKVYAAIHGPLYQATGARMRICYEHGYANIYQQVGFFAIETEEDFVSAWEGMDGNSLDGKIDEVDILSHGNYFALIINAKGCQNLTTSPYNRVSSDTSCVNIRDLTKKRIGTIRIVSCNSGLLNAIDLAGYCNDFANDNTIYNSTLNLSDPVELRGNVAQAFLETQDVDYVYAWDGSVTPGSDGTARLSKDDDQDKFRKYISGMSNVSTYNPNRNMSGNKYLPIGEVIYFRKNDSFYCGYVLDSEYICINLDDLSDRIMNEDDWKQFFEID